MLIIFANANFLSICKTIIASRVQLYSVFALHVTKLNAHYAKKDFLTIKKITYVSVQMTNNMTKIQANVNKKLV